MIRGITHTEGGESIQRLAVTTKIAIGLPPDPALGKKGHPTKLDHFIFLKKSATEQNKWEIDQELTKLFGAKCKTIEIVLLDDDVENVFPTKLAWFTQSQCKCFGNGVTATRRTDKHPEGEPWEPCGPTCPDLQNGDCKPSGDLRFMLAAMPKLGSVVRIHTSSVRSVQQISSSLQQIQTLLGGRLAGVRCNLVVRPEKTSYEGTDGKRHSTTIYAMNLEIQAEGIHALISKMTDHARLFEQTRKILGTGRIEVVEEDTERAPEISSEFYPASDIAPASVKFPEPEAEEEVVQTKKQANMDVKCGHCGGVNGHESDCKYAGTSGAAKTAQKSEPEVVSGPVKSMYHVISVVSKKSAAKGDFVLLTAMNLQNQKGSLYAWDKRICDFLLSRTYEKPLPMIAEVSEQEEKGKKFYQIDRLLELGTKVFEDEPEMAVAEGEPGESLFGSE